MAAKKKVSTLLAREDLSYLPELFYSADYLVGLDEVGVACLAGPVVAGCFAYQINDSRVLDFIPAEPVRDSKQLSEDQRERSQRHLEEKLSGLAFWSTAEASVPEIDELNIYHASGLAMKRALEKVLLPIEKLNPAFRALIVVDGNRIPHALRSLGDRHYVVPVVKGDTKVFAVAAASIFAKNHRDPFMKKLALQYAGYGWETNVGYPTPKHKEAVKKLGANSWHRTSFNLDF